MFIFQRMRLGLWVIVALTGLGSHVVWAEDSPLDDLWADFNHYVRIARPDLANAAGSALLKQADAQKILDVVEASEYDDYPQTLERAARIESLQDTVQKLAGQIQSARIKRSREPKRILADIQLLVQGNRPNFNATQRLKAGGQFAAPYLLATLLDEEQQELHSAVLAAMVAVGRPMVYPLSVALNHLEPVQLEQTAQVLAQIGYPQALPYLKEVIETSRANAATISVVQSAFNKLVKAATLSSYDTASDLYFRLGTSQYTKATVGTQLLGADPETKTGQVWEYDREAGLVAIPVPIEVFGDVLAMRSSQQALRLQPQMDSALSLWLMANLRRENRLPEGARDKSYSSSMHPPSFYIEMAGPLRQHDVLDRALNDGDVNLALDAIQALATTSGTEALLNRKGTVQPLLRALAYPDRRVRFNAAFAMTNAQPRFSFPGSELVVPVLAEAVRQSATRHVITIGSDRDSLNQLMVLVTELGYQPIGGLSLDDVAGQINTSPSVDLIVIEHSAGRIEALYRHTSVDYRLATVPIVGIVSPVDRTKLSNRLPQNKRMILTTDAPQPETMRPVFDQASKINLGAPINAKEADRFAVTALTLLQEVLASNINVFNVPDAQPTLIQALEDSRREIAARAARVLSLIDDPNAQRGIADAATDPTRPLDLRADFLQSLSESARFYGNYLNEIQLDKLLDMVKTERGDLVIAAAQAHGALTLPTSNVVQLIAGKAVQ